MVAYPALLEFERGAVVDVVAYIFFVGQDLVNRAPCPGTLLVLLLTGSVKRIGDGPLRLLDSKNSL